MHARTSGSFTAILMLLPLIAVPMFAVFGIPQFAPVVASLSSQLGQNQAQPAIASETGEMQNSSNADYFQEQNENWPNSRRARPQAAVMTSPSSGDQWDPFAQQASYESESMQPATARVPHAKSSPPQRAMQGWAVDPARATETSTEFHAVAVAESRGLVNGSFEGEFPQEGQQQRVPLQQSEPLTWQEAAARLAELGIRQYKLEPGERMNEFHFACSYTPKDDPRITHRFEAEATEPILAVKKVLAQIEEWLQYR